MFDDLLPVWCFVFCAMYCFMFDDLHSHISPLTEVIIVDKGLCSIFTIYAIIQLLYLILTFRFG